LRRTFDVTTYTERLDTMAAAQVSEFPSPTTWVHKDAFAYDDDENITRIRDDLNTGAQGSQRQCFTYDQLSRLTYAWTTNTQCTDQSNPNTSYGADGYYRQYAYDQIGNIQRVWTTPGSGGTDYVYSATKPHFLTQAGADTYGFDGNGAQDTRTVGGVTSTLAWTRDHHLGSVTTAGQVTSFVYDADGNRLLRRAPSGATTTTTLYLEQQELSKTGTDPVVGTRYYSLSGVTVAVRQSGTLHWLLGNHQGSASATVRNNDGTTNRQRYLPFGAPRGTPGQITQTDRGFLGKTEDDTTNLVQLDARYYDPNTAHFISVDPLLSPGDPRTLNGYAYAANSPVSRADPTGLTWEGLTSVSWAALAPYAQAQADADAYIAERTPACQNLPTGTTTSASFGAACQSQQIDLLCELAGGCAPQAGFVDYVREAYWEPYWEGVKERARCITAVNQHQCLSVTIARQTAADVKATISQAQACISKAGPECAELFAALTVAVFTKRLIARAHVRVAAEEGLPGLSTDAAQLEAKFKHAADFGITESRGAAGFESFGKAVDSFVSDPDTVRVMGTYRGDAAILNYNPSTAQVVVQAPDGSFISGWQMSPAQLQNVIARGSLGGG
jgi:RHS repeat-associated protein